VKKFVFGWIAALCARQLGLEPLMLKKAIVVAVMVVGIPLGTWAVSIKCPKEPANAWAQSLSASEKTAIMPHAAEMPKPYLAAFLHVLSTDQQIAVWQHGLTLIPYPSKQYPQTPARDAAIKHYESVLTAEYFKADIVLTSASQERKSNLAALKAEILQAFDVDMFNRLSIGAGQVAHYTRGGLPNGQGLAFLRTHLPKTAPWHLLTYMKEVTTLYAAPYGCDCNDTCSINFVCEEGPDICNPTSWGCGWFGFSSCNAICARELGQQY
jgi:hypothetical protein